MAKDWEDKGYWGKYDSLNDIGKSLGINYQDYSDNDSETGRNYTKKGTRSDFEDAVLAAGEHSAIYQGALQAGKASGNKRFAGLGDGISNIAELGNLNTAMKKTHKKDMGNTGNYSSANDRGNVLSYLNEEYEQSFKDDILDDVRNSIPKQNKDDDDDDKSTVAGPSYIDHFGLDEEIAKATAGYNADGTPAGPRLNAQSFLSKAVKDAVYGPQDAMGKAHNNQDQYALSFEDSELELNPGSTRVTPGIGLG